MGQFPLDYKEGQGNDTLLNANSGFGLLDCIRVWSWLGRF